jgi:LysM repeat protein
MKKCSLFIVLAIQLSSCAVKHSPAPIEYKHSQSRLHGDSVAGEETVSTINTEGEIISTDNQKTPGQQQEEYIDPVEDDNYVIPSKVSKADDKIIYHEVQSGETIEMIAAKYGQSVEAIARLNDLYPPYYLDEFQNLKIKTDKSLAQGVPPVRNIPQEEPLPPAPKKSPEFIKPVDGTIISKFGENTANGVNKGINIAATAGTEVKASANGRVIYADYDATFGNLGMIKVDNKNIVIAYAHLEDILLAKGSVVKQGELVGYVGSTGKAGGKPQLHFAIREGKNAVDPVKYIGN